MCVKQTMPTTPADLAADMALQLREAARAIEFGEAGRARLTVLAIAKRLDASRNASNKRSKGSKGSTSYSRQT